MNEKRKATGATIRSGGQSGVDRAALDAALLTGLPYEGWCPKGGWAEDFPQPPGLLAKYPRLKESPKTTPEQRTEWNVRDSAATVLIIPDSNLHSKGSDYTIQCAKKYGRPYHLVHLLDARAVPEIKQVISGLSKGQSLNFAGPRESECPGVYDLCLASFIKAFE
jgi:hypothetical protein